MAQNGKNDAHSYVAQNGKNAEHLYKWLKMVKMRLAGKNSS